VLFGAAGAWLLWDRLAPGGRGDGPLWMVVAASWAGWPVSLPSWKAQTRRVAGRNLTCDEWSRFVPGRSYAKVCG
jgi:hypothetical protein